jgi:methyl-accepting chemotaxis protein
MLTSLRFIWQRHSYPISIQALLTASILLLLYVITQHPLVLLTCIGYGVVGVYGIVTQRPSADDVTPAVAPEAPAQMLPMTTLEIPTVSVDGEADAGLSTRIGVTVDGLVRATYAMNAVTTEQSSSAEEQAAVIQLTNRLLDEFLLLSERISQQARTITQVAEQSAEISAVGQTAMQQSIGSMDDIRVQVEAIGTKIATLARFTRRIDEIITSVSEIATQSNLLALNASIEAARAGVHGRGFAVVADEVRSLSQQSTQAAGQIRAILVEIQKAMRETVRATESGVTNVTSGVARTQEAYDVMTRLANSVNRSRDSVREIYQVIQQQSSGMEEIAINIERIERLIGQSLASTRTVETVSANLNRLASDLQTTIGQPASPEMTLFMR